MNQETHPFQVSIWIPGNEKPKSIFEKGHWMEMARCITKERAKEVALCLSIRHSQGVQAAELVSDERGTRFVGYKYIPESAKELQ
ncbi:MAG TPA: hypothetical protein VFA10_30270 [Ktedonobacteraceae bacterium]|nr:hypothetical protein [Ktedonobacteraceae bacterium]